MPSSGCRDVASVCRVECGVADGDGMAASVTRLFKLLNLLMVAWVAAAAITLCEMHGLQLCPPP